MNTEETQKIFKLVRVVLVILAVFLAAEAVASLKGLHNMNPAYNSISVNGEGEAVAIPDIATFSFTVSADAKVVSDAQSAVTRKIDAILAELEKLGIEEKDIKTGYYSVYPKYTYPQIYCITTPCMSSREQVQDGYTASHSISVKVRKTEDAGKAVAVAGDNGATDISGISFTIDDREKITQEARLEAIADAKAKAEMLADQLGVRLVRIVNFYDNTGVMPYYSEGMGGDSMVKTLSNPVSAPTIPLGENNVNVNVTVVYEIR